MPNETITVYLIVHELFGALFDGKKILLVTPIVKGHVDEQGHVHEHQYKIARFKEGKWQHDVKMDLNETYELRGVVPRHATSTSVPCHSEFSPHPPGKFQLNPNNQPYCTWQLSLPKQIHQLRLIAIPDCDRPVFRGDPHGDTVEVQLCAVSLVHAFEYERVSEEEFGIFSKNGEVKGLDYLPDTVTKTINLHLWAQLEDESGMDQRKADEHAAKATKALVALFQENGKALNMEGLKSLSIDNGHSTQVRTPLGIRFPELMTLAERFTLLGGRHMEDIECTGKTCGHGGNLYLNA